MLTADDSGLTLLSRHTSPQDNSDRPSSSLLMCKSVCRHTCDPISGVLCSWESEPERCVAAGKQVIDQLREATNVGLVYPSPIYHPVILTAPQIVSGTSDIPVPSLAATIFGRLKRRFDATHGGFSGAPKFPQPAQTMHFLARYAALNRDAKEGEGNKEAEQALDMAVQTMVKIYSGGIRDVVSGGFSRYSVDERWHVPHCECPSLLKEYECGKQCILYS